MRGYLVLGVVTATMVAGCEIEVTTSPTAHESAPFDPPPPQPTFTFSTYLGGSGDDRVLDVASTLGTAPLVFVVGGTSSTDFPTTDGTTLDPATSAGCAGCPYDAFAMRIDAPGQVVWSTVIGGPGFEEATAVAVAIDLDVFIGGSAAELPATTGAADATFAGGDSAERGGEDGFVCRLDGATGQRRWCTFVGGAGTGGVTSLAADPASDGVVAVLTTVASEALDDDPAYAAAFAGRHRAAPGGTDTVVVRIAGDGRSFSWATYVGGSGDEPAPATVSIDINGVHVLTTTASTDAPTPNGVVTTAPGGTNAYYALLIDDAATVRYATYLGGSGDDWVSGKSLLAEGSVAVGINTRSVDVDVTANAVQPSFGGGGTAGCGAALGDGWLGLLAPAASGTASLAAATYVGGSRGDSLDAITRDRSYDAVIAAGRTFSSDFPTLGFGQPPFGFPRGAPCTTDADNSDGSITSLPRAGLFADRHYGSYFGGSDEDRIAAADRGGSHLIGFGGDTRSLDFPVVGPLSSSRRGPRDGFVAVLGRWDFPVAAGDAGPDATGPGGTDGDAGCCGTAPMSAPRGLAFGLLVLAAAIPLRRRRAR